MAAALTKNWVLTTLILGIWFSLILDWNGICDSGARELADALSRNRTLISLGLSIPHVPKTHI